MYGVGPCVPRSLVEQWAACYSTVCDIDGTPMMICSLIITGWVDRTDDGFSGREGEVCESATG